MPLNVRIQGPRAHQQATVQLGVSQSSEREGKRFWTESSQARPEFQLLLIS